MTDILISLAKAAILVVLNQPDNFDLEHALKTFPILQEDGAAFITLTTEPNDRLRGCIGSLQAYRPLYKDIISNAQAAALRDPRFKPLTIEELDHIKIEVSILSEPKKIEYRDLQDLKNKITPYQDGIILKLQGNQATYLPQVWEDLPKFDAFFSSLCQKANLRSNCLSQHPEISNYQVTKYKEK
ncbi:MAG: AmmeMemoRadiSam system protein A [Campylobacterota bacterium]|nr:AmmeMemoRadiSam system protein A [Campylobacterota bacterium]